MTSVQELADAAMAGDGDAVRGLLAEDGGLAREYTAEGWTALHLAASAEIAAMLIDAGADINARNRHKVFGPGNSPLSAATYQQRLDVVRLLIERGADVNQGDNVSFAPLHLAAASGYLEIARVLLDAGADANARTGESAGARYGNKTPMELLADPDRRRDDGTVVPPQADAAMNALLRQHGAAS